MSQESNETRRSLILRIRDVDDDQAWSEFIDIYTPVVFRFLRRRGLQDADASDVSQEVMRSVAQAIDSFEHREQNGAFRAWLLESLATR